MDNRTFSFTPSVDGSILEDAQKFAEYLTEKIKLSNVGAKFFATCSNGIITYDTSRQTSSIQSK